MYVSSSTPKKQILIVALNKNYIKISFNRLYEKPLAYFHESVWNIFSEISNRSKLQNNNIKNTTKNYLKSLPLSLHISFIPFKQSLKKFSDKEDFFSCKCLSRVSTGLVLK